MTELRVTLQGRDKGTNQSQITELLERSVHAFLHNQQLLLLFLGHARNLAVLLVDPGKQLLDLVLLGLYVSSG